MNKIALTLILVMTLGTCFVLSSCNDSSNSSNSSSNIKNEISSELKYELMSEMAWQSVKVGVTLYYTDHTITIKEIDDNLYSVYGTATAMNSGTKYTADYAGTVEYDANSDEFEFDIEVENFRK